MPVDESFTRYLSRADIHANARQLEAFSTGRARPPRPLKNLLFVLFLFDIAMTVIYFGLYFNRKTTEIPKS